MKPFPNAHRVLGGFTTLAKKAHVHQMLGLIIVVAHAAQIGEVVAHISIWHLMIAALLFALWLYSPEHEHAEEI